MKKTLIEGQSPICNFTKGELFIIGKGKKKPERFDEFIYRTLRKIKKDNGN